MPDSLPALTTERLALRPMADDDIEPLLEMVRASEWWGDADEDDLRCDGMAFAIEVDGQLAGWLGVSEENEQDYRHAALDITLMSEYQNRGLGPEALRTAIDWLMGARGHHRFTIDPAAHNKRAIAAYERVGFRPVGIMRRYERSRDGTWHDGLLMDLVSEGR
jgi:aminoglycoside 6'-N-acetyltransferase